MSRFRDTKKREVPEISTAALPDLIFTILFFFMLVTNMRPVPVKTQFDLPQASELQKLKEKSEVVYIMVGKNQNTVKDSDFVIQFNSDFVSLEEMSVLLEKTKESFLEKGKTEIVVSFKADKNAPMGLINDIKDNLREAGLLTIHYSANK